jgi:hypothetical protein
VRIHHECQAAEHAFLVAGWARGPGVGIGAARQAVVDGGTHPVGKIIVIGHGQSMTVDGEFRDTAARPGRHPIARDHG